MCKHPQESKYRIHVNPWCLSMRAAVTARPQPKSLSATSACSSQHSGVAPSEEEGDSWRDELVIHELYSRVHDASLRDPELALVAHHSMYSSYSRLYGFSMDEEVKRLQGCKKALSKVGGQGNDRGQRTSIAEADLLSELNGPGADAGWEDMNLSIASPGSADEIRDRAEVCAHVEALGDLSGATLASIAANLAQPFSRATWRQSAERGQHKMALAAFLWVALHMTYVPVEVRQRKKEPDPAQERRPSVKGKRRKSSSTRRSSSVMGGLVPPSGTHRGGASSVYLQSRNSQVGLNGGSGRRRRSQSRRGRSNDSSQLHSEVDGDGGVSEVDTPLEEAVLTTRRGDAVALATFLAALVKEMGVPCDVVTGVRKLWGQQLVPWAWNCIQLPVRREGVPPAPGAASEAADGCDTKRFVLDVAMVCQASTPGNEPANKNAGKSSGASSKGTPAPGVVERIELQETLEVRGVPKTLLSNRTKRSQVTKVLEVRHKPPPPLFILDSLRDSARGEPQPNVEPPTQLPVGITSAAVATAQKSLGVSLFYFKAHPVRFAAEHYPDNPYYSLLRRPVNRGSWEQYPFLAPAFFTHHLQLDSHRKRCTLNIRSTPFYIRLLVDEPATTELWCAMYKTTLRNITAALDSIQPLDPEWVWQQREEGAKCVTFSLMAPSVGYYTIVIGVRRTGIDDLPGKINSFQVAVAYEAKVAFVPRTKPMFPRQLVTPVFCKLIEPLAKVITPGLQHFVVMPTNANVMAVAVVNHCQPRARGVPSAADGGRDALGELAVRRRSRATSVTAAANEPRDYHIMTLLTWCPEHCAFEGSVDVSLGNVDLWVVFRKKAKPSTGSSGDDPDENSLTGSCAVIVYDTTCRPASAAKKDGSTRPPEATYGGYRVDLRGGDADGTTDDDSRRSSGGSDTATCGITGDGDCNSEEGFLASVVFDEKEQVARVPVVSGSPTNPNCAGSTLSGPVSLASLAKQKLGRRRRRRWSRGGTGNSYTVCIPFVTGIQVKRVAKPETTLNGGEPVIQPVLSIASEAIPALQLIIGKDALQRQQDDATCAPNASVGTYFEAAPVPRK